MATIKTPGVYVEEIQTLAPSVAQVPTSIPGFVGYTQKAEFLDGSSAAMKPVRITSLLEYEQIFGFAYPEEFEVDINNGNIAISRITAAAQSNYILYYQLQMFYANGGGRCYVVSVGDYTAAIDDDTLMDGLDELEKIDEVTLLVTPETVALNTLPLRRNVYDHMLTQCAKLQDRFAILDTVHINGNTIFQDSTAFRDNDISADNLKYGAAYYPALSTGINYFYVNTDVTITGNSPYTGDTLDTILNGDITPATTATATIEVDVQPTAPDIITINGVTLANPADYAVGANVNATALNLFNAIASKVPSVIAVNVVANVITIKAQVPGTVGDITIADDTNPPFIVVNPGASNAVINTPADKDLYNAVAAELSKTFVQLYPSASMAGIYARVDAERGVWKAPANVGVRLISGPSIQITSADQENLNVDSVSGKSINVIRFFAGRGNLVWGARTLAGNDNEWRYINVRRLFLLVEESLKKATEFVVFESNTATTWTRVRAMSEAFLTSLWRDGALAGATTQDAFFVKVGLGTTMTPQDILEGRMNVEIGIAASRPAEFIILRFSHKLQES